MKNSLFIGRILGIPIYLHYTWFIVFGLLAWSLAGGFFPERYPDLPTSAYWARGLVAAILLFASVLFHELAHSYVALYYRIDIASITLFAFGGVAQLREDPPTPQSEFTVAIAGPISSALLAILFWGLVQISLATGRLLFIGAVSVYLFQLNLVLATFNLVPAFPLDGGRILRAGLWYFTGKRQATRIASSAGQIFAYFLIVTGVLSLLGGGGPGSIWSILIGWFLKDASATAYQQVRLDDLLAGVKVKDLMVSDVEAVSSTLTIDELVRDYFLRFAYGGYPVVEGEKVCGIVSLRDVKTVPQERWHNTRVKEIMIPLERAPSIAPDRDIIQALKVMAETEYGRLLVKGQDGRCLGLITHNGILRYLTLQEELGILRNPAGRKAS
ncbi:MAG: site-2 protease family protein [Candidatus Tectomicrobia bacterium]|nr:site-2 protease family protein [Candidatus Tectomicrobia bacterium]